MYAVAATDTAVINRYWIMDSGASRHLTFNRQKRVSREGSIPDYTLD